MKRRLKIALHHSQMMMSQAMSCSMSRLLCHIVIDMGCVIEYNSVHPAGVVCECWLSIGNGMTEACLNLSSSVACELC